MMANEKLKKEKPLCPIHRQPLMLTVIDGDEQFVCHECQTEADKLLEKKEEIPPTLDGWKAD